MTRLPLLAGLALAAWISCGLVAAGLYHANLRAESRIYDPMHSARKDLSFSLAVGLIGGPAALISALAVTGFGEDGWSLSLKSEERQ